MFWLIKGNTKSTIKNIVNGKIIQTLKKTHWSLVKFLQTISFKTAKKIKKIDHLNVNFFHITSSSLKAWNAIFKKTLLNFSPPKRIKAKTKFIIVGLSLIKSGSCKNKVRLPKNKTKSKEYRINFICYVYVFNWINGKENCQRKYFKKEFNVWFHFFLRNYFLLKHL